MGHAIHFLERLERLSMPQADFALALYRDPALVRFVLATVKLPEGVERVALALEHGPATPHVIVARDGGFVTCLGKDMSVGDHVVIARERLDRLSAEHGELRQAVERVRDMGYTRQLRHRLCRFGPGLPREDVHTLRALYPLYWPELYKEANDLADWLQEFRVHYRRSRFRRMSAVAREGLRGYWEASWALGHLTALHGTVLREVITPLLPRLSDAASLGTAVSWYTTRTMSTPLVLRGAWAAACAGNELLPVYRRKFEQAQTKVGFIDAMVGLTAIGLRHRKLRGEVRKILARRRNPDLAPDSKNPVAESIRLLLPSYEQVLENDEPARLAHRVIGVAMFKRVCEKADADHPVHGLAGPDRVPPDEIAYLFPLLLDTSLHGDAEAQVFLPLLLPWVVGADLEELYFPAETLAGLRFDAPFERVLTQLDDYARYMNPIGTVRRAATPGRNQPCSCGSGKKYKRCCGASAVSP
jgi:hypothetical protein